MSESFIVVAEYDFLSDDAKTFVEMLIQAEIENHFYVVKGILHSGFRLMKEEL